MDRRFIDKSGGRKPTVRIAFRTGPIFKVCQQMSLREAVAIVLTQDMDDELKEIVRKIHREGNRAAESDTDRDVLINSEPHPIDAELPESDDILTITLDD
jgi:predicted lactoylglutathione lyase